jgi:cytochrome c5
MTTTYVFAVATIGAAVAAIASSAAAQTPAPASETKVENAEVTQEKIELSGAELWTMNCNRCHMFRSSGEFTAAQWQSIMLHMRVRANIPAAQAREILKFLQAGAGK